MILRAILPLAFLALATCGDPFAAPPDSDGPRTGAVEVTVEVPGNFVTWDEDGFALSSPYFTLPFQPLGGSVISPDLPGGLPVRLHFTGLAEWCHPNAASQQVTVVPDDTVQVLFIVNCEVLIRPVYFLARAVPDTLPPFQVGVQIALQRAFTLTTGVWHLDSLPVSTWPVTVTPPAGCHRDPNEGNTLAVGPFNADTIRYVITVICDP
jgi:hypothetical protein